MASTVKGVYRNGHVELLQKPQGVQEGDVEVTLRNPCQDHEAHGSVDDRRQRARRWLREEGWKLGGAPYPTRDELHDRTR